METRDKDEIIAALQAEVDSLRTIISLTPGNVYWKDQHGNYLGCNQHFAHILKLASPDDIVGLSDEALMAHILTQHTSPGSKKHFADILKSIKLESTDPLSDQKKLARFFAAEIHKIDNKVIHANQEHCEEEMGLDEDGLPATYLTRKTPLFDRQNNLKGILGISFDITDRKRIEQKLKVAKKKAEAANIAKSRFLAMISHELRTPLTSILGFANLLQQTDVKANDQHAFAEHITNSGAYLLSLINNLLDYNKLETNKYAFTRFPVNLKELTTNIVSMLHVTAREKQLLLKLEYADDAPELILSNHQVLRQILINLIGNAIKFTQKGHVIVRVSCKKATESTATLEIAIEDTGIGIPDSEKHSIFKHFTQLGSVYTRKQSLTGTGLGLAIVKKLVKLLPGKIRVKSKLNQGTTFYVTCPFATLAAHDVPWLPYAEKVRILAIQQNESDTTLQTLLVNTFHDTISADEAAEAILISQHSAQPYDILLFDQRSASRAPHLQALLQDKSDCKQPLCLSLDNGAMTSPAGIHAVLSVTPVALDPKPFQLALTRAWECWQQQICKQRQPALSHPHVLLVEDNELIQIIHKNMLEDLGCQVDISDSANTTLQMLDQPYDILFVDLGLPDIAGFELIKKVRQKNNRLANIPIIVLTGYSEEAERERCLRVGADEVAVKPINKTALESILKRYISQ